jgi:purine-binding chemotaxis protein CheW
VSALLELLLCKVDGAPYAFPVERVREIVRMRPITPIPRAPETVRGAISLRGQIVQVIDLRRRLGMPPAEPTRSSRFVVLRGDEGSVTAILVDSVREVLRLPEPALCEAPAQCDAVEVLCERDGAFVSVLDLDRVLDLDGV